MTAVLPRPTPALLDRPRPRPLVLAPTASLRSPAPARPRKVWTDCDGNRHHWVITPAGVVCQHCPMYARPTTHRSGQ